MGNVLDLCKKMSPKFRPVKYVLFDMDGLLLDTETIYYKTFEEVLARYGVKYDQTMRVKIMGTVPKDTYSIFIRDYNLDVSLEKLTEEIKEMLLKRMVSAEFMPGAVRLIEHLKKCNIPIAVATSSSEEVFLVKTSRHQDIFSKFNHITLGGSDPEVKHGKPAPDVFLVCASRFPADPRECLVFEDAPNGVEGAIAAGMQVVMVPDKVVPAEKRALATKVIESLEDFVPEEFGLPTFNK